MTSNLPFLRHFLAIYRAGRIGLAAAGPGVSQPGLSKSLRRLENELGVALFERSSSGIVATPYGQALARRAKVIEAEGRRALQEVAQIGSALVGSASVGVGPALASYDLAETLPTFLAGRPDMRVSVFEGLYGALLERLRAGALDFAITTRPFIGPTETGIEAALFRRDRFVVASGSSHPLANQAPPLGPALVEYPACCRREAALYGRASSSSSFGPACAHPSRQVETSSTGLMLSLISAGPYLTCVSETLFSREIGGGAVTVLPDPAFAIEREVVVLTRAGTFLSPAAEALLAAMRSGKPRVARPPEAEAA